MRMGVRMRERVTVRTRVGIRVREEADSHGIGRAKSQYEHIIILKAFMAWI